MTPDEPGRAGEEYPHLGAQTTRDRPRRRCRCRARGRRRVGSRTTAGAAAAELRLRDRQRQPLRRAGQVAERLGAFDLVVVDGELATADEVAALRAGGTTVLAYLSVGTIEKWRGWYPQLKRFRLGAWADWKDEWFADVSKAKLRRAISAEIAPRDPRQGLRRALSRQRRHDRDPQPRRPARRDARAGARRWRRSRMPTGGCCSPRTAPGGCASSACSTRSTAGIARTSPGPTTSIAAATSATPIAPGAPRCASSPTSRDRGPDHDGRQLHPCGRSAGAAESVADACGVGALPYVGDIGLTARRLPDPPLICP